MHHHTKYHQNWSIGVEDITFNVFQHGGCPPSWIEKNDFLTVARIQSGNVCKRAKFQTVAEI